MSDFETFSVYSDSCLQRTALVSDTLRSAIAQTWPHKEIIVVDDGSRTRLWPWLSSLNRPAFLCSVRRTRGRQRHAIPLFLWRGSYIQWLDADYSLAPDKITRQMATLGEKPNTRIVFSSAWGRLCIAPPRRVRSEPIVVRLCASEWFLRYMENDIYMQTATWLISPRGDGNSRPRDTRLLATTMARSLSRVVGKRGSRFVAAKVCSQCSGRPEFIGSCSNGDPVALKSADINPLRRPSAVVTGLTPPRRRIHANWMILLSPEGKVIF